MLDYGGVDDELVLGRAAGGLGLGDEGFEDGIDNVVVPGLRGGVLVDAGGADGGVACVVADLAEAGCGDGLWRVVSGSWEGRGTVAYGVGGHLSVVVVGSGTETGRCLGSWLWFFRCSVYGRQGSLHRQTTSSIVAAALSVGLAAARLANHMPRLELVLKVRI